MFGKVKKWLGIEGVKISLLIPQEIYINSKELEGNIKLESMHTQTVTKITISLFEKYTRGRFKQKLTDVYKMGEIELTDSIVVPAHEPVFIDFVLPFEHAKSEMDELADKNIVLKKMVGTAKLLKNVKSEFYIQAEAEVSGTALSPFEKLTVKMKG